ncbi:MAG: hypothetical protein ACI8SR_000471 [Oceanicoccus sp.]|jgi:hypothetical protein
MKKILFVLFLICSQSVLAFSDLGHKMVAAAAWQQLTPFAKQTVERLLGSGEANFIEASVWADRIKSNEEFNYLKPLHYVNMPKNAANYRQARDCKKNKCVVEAIKDFSRIAKTGSEKEQTLALRMLIHLIADVHQPLHAGLFEDRGGNWYEIKYEGSSMTLHKFWDNHVVKRFDQDAFAGAQKIIANDVAVDVSNPVKWAEESHVIVVDSVYLAEENNVLSDEYLLMADTIMQQQLSRASWRLAMWLNTLW